MSVAQALGFGPWAFADLEKLPDDGLRYEVVDGTLVVSPAPSRQHQMLGKRLLLQLDRQLTSGWEVGYEMSLTSEGGGRIPDLAIVRVAPFDPDRPYCSPEDFSLVIEIVSPSSRSTDRILKPVEYAALGVPYYWRVEIEPTVELFGYRLVDEAYVQAAHLTSGRGAVPGPCPLVVDIDDLARP